MNSLNGMKNEILSDKRNLNRFHSNGLPFAVYSAALFSLSLSIFKFYCTESIHPGHIKYSRMHANWILIVYSRRGSVCWREKERARRMVGMKCETETETVSECSERSVVVIWNSLSIEAHQGHLNTTDNDPRTLTFQLAAKHAALFQVLQKDRRTHIHT